MRHSLPIVPSKDLKNNRHARKTDDIGGHNLHRISSHRIEEWKAHGTGHLRVMTRMWVAWGWNVASNERTKAILIRFSYISKKAGWINCNAMLGESQHLPFEFMRQISSACRRVETADE